MVEWFVLKKLQFMTHRFYISITNHQNLGANNCLSSEGMWQPHLQKWRHTGKKTIYDTTICIARVKKLFHNNNQTHAEVSQIMQVSVAGIFKSILYLF